MTRPWPQHVEQLLLFGETEAFGALFQCAEPTLLGADQLLSQCAACYAPCFSGAFCGQCDGGLCDADAACAAPQSGAVANGWDRHALVRGARPPHGYIPWMHQCTTCGGTWYESHADPFASGGEAEEGG